MATAQTQMQPQPTQQPGISRWWRVVGGLSMNLALGTLYAWSVFVAPLEKQFGWRRADTSMPIAVMAHMITRKATPMKVTQKSELARPLAPISRKK